MIDFWRYLKNVLSIPRKAATLALILIGALFFIIYALQDNIVERHEHLCRQNSSVIVRDKKLWIEYRVQDELAFQERRAKWGPETERALFEIVSGYRQVYGEGKADTRPYENGKITRNDIFLMKGEVIVVQLVDFIAQYGSIDGPTGFSCLRFRPNLYQF